MLTYLEDEVRRVAEAVPANTPDAEKGGLEQITWKDGAILGLVQCLALVPGVSRSGATIVGGLYYLDGNPPPDAIYLTGLGTAGVARALVEHGCAGVKFVCYDRIPETLELLRERIVNFTITQDPFMQGYQPVKILFDALFNGTQPESEHIRTRIEILTAENI